ncbi:UvrD-helicase domain-containing protein [Janthinobacterium rivuli]|uniref:UvrD-helicase domain-containing protein n=1 Tax=Janthinobacterium rivuli TaxID=2751478 RepID=UPI00383B1A88
MSSMTREQISVVENESMLLAVDAFAGTGKTTTLVEYSKCRPDKRILYIAFNKSVASEACARFPENVQCRTTHSLAYTRVGKRYQEKLGSPKAWEIAQTFQCNTTRAKDALQTLSNWFCSADSMVAEEHLDVELQGDPAVAADIVQLAGKVFAAMKDKRSPIKMPHDGYLKIWALELPLLAFDIILLDEAQDTNPVTLDVVMRQDCQKVLVGDRHQGIYGFRRAVNAMERVQAKSRVALTQSFRFSEQIAGIASALLADFKGEDKTIVGRADMTNAWNVDRSQPFTIIGRTNAGLFSSAAELVLGNDVKLHFIGGFDSYVFGKVLDAYFLWADERSRITSPSIGRFNCFGDFQRYGVEAGDLEIAALVKTVEQYQGQIPRIYEAMKASQVSLQEKADVTLTTAHRAKGLEFDQVHMQDDFIELPPEKQYDPEEINLLYVALTRAIHAVRLPESLTRWLRDRAQRTNSVKATETVDGTERWHSLQGEMSEREAWVRENVEAFDRTSADVIRFLLQKVDILRDALD